MELAPEISRFIREQRTGLHKNLVIVLHIQSVAWSICQSPLGVKNELKNYFG